MLAKVYSYNFQIGPFFARVLDFFKVIFNNKSFEVLFGAQFWMSKHFGRGRGFGPWGSGNGVHARHLGLIPNLLFVPRIRKRHQRTFTNDATLLKVEWGTDEIIRQNNEFKQFVIIFVDPHTYKRAWIVNLLLWRSFGTIKTVRVSKL